MTLLWLVPLLVAVYAVGRAVGLRLAALRLRRLGPDVVVTVRLKDREPFPTRMRPGQTLQINLSDGSIFVAFAETRQLPTEVATMLEEVTR